MATQPMVAQQRPRFGTHPPLSLYIHLPWCVRKCPYCDFNSHEAPDHFPEQEYADALIADLDQDLPRIWGRTIQTIFLGGGTPNLFSGSTIDNLLSQLRSRLRLSPTTEITMEANPGACHIEQFARFREAGINRLSLGVQSFNDDSLQNVGRIHNGRQAYDAVISAREAGFDNINLDLMFGLPGQSASIAHNDLQTAIELYPEHISYYQLTIEPNTAFHQNPPPQGSDTLLWRIQRQAQHELQKHGYHQYEVSAYARDGQRCQHNLNYWQYGDYLGIGAGAHSKLTDPNSQTITRLTKVRHPARYLATAGSPSAIQREERLETQQIILEFMMNTLRLTDGFESRLFAAHTGLSLALIQRQLTLAEEAGLLCRDALRIRPTARGVRYLNNLLELFVTC